ncbi:MAG: hypothetical protein OXG81_01980 [Acidobacteria bacterium]|nr:hypothetical protein [Acidobacteriota bacterium]
MKPASPLRGSARMRTRRSAHPENGRRSWAPLYATDGIALRIRIPDRTPTR